jgi:hypothetical protein
MNNKKLTELSNEELLKNEKSIKSITTIFYLVILLLIFSSIYITIKKGFGVFTIFPLFFIPFLFTNRISLKEIQKEINSRN